MHVNLCLSNYLSDINECASSPCPNNAICEDSANGYHCSCMLGYTGDHCETGKECYILNVRIPGHAYLSKRSYLIHMCSLLQKWTCVRATRARTKGHARRPPTNTTAPVRPTTAGSIAKQVGRTLLICFGSDLIWSSYMHISKHRFQQLRQCNGLIITNAINFVLMGEKIM